MKYNTTGTIPMSYKFRLKKQNPKPMIFLLVI